MPPGAMPRTMRCRATGTRSSGPARRSTPTSTSSCRRTRSSTSTPAIRTSSRPARRRSIRTGRRYGLRFPVVSIDDFVALQKALVESLGIQRLRRSSGASMGALQAYQWAVSHPDMVDRILPVIGAAGGDPFLIAWLDIWSAAATPRPEMARRRLSRMTTRPSPGMTASLKIVTLHAHQSDWASITFGRRRRCPGATRPRRCRTGS